MSENICNKCSLRHSSYCLNCQFVKYGLCLTDAEYMELLKKRKENNDETD